jgi:hypothetical protein
LVLAVQRQLPLPLVDHRADHEAQVGAAAFEHAQRGRRAVQGQRIAPLGHRARSYFST